MEFLRYGGEHRIAASDQQVGLNRTAPAEEGGNEVHTGTPAE
jgi:hypothetical protein